MDEHTILDELPVSLRTDVTTYNCRILLQNVPFFQNCEPGLIPTIVRLLAPNIFLSGDVIVRYGEFPSEVYFIQSGEVQIVLFSKVVTYLAQVRVKRRPTSGHGWTHARTFNEGQGMHVCQFCEDDDAGSMMRSVHYNVRRTSVAPWCGIQSSQGSFFGEMAFMLPGRRRTADVHAVKDCELFSLKKEHLDNILIHFTEVKAAMLRIAQHRNAYLEEFGKQTAPTAPQLEEEVRVTHMDTVRSPVASSGVIRLDFGVRAKWYPCCPRGLDSLVPRAVVPLTDDEQDDQAGGEREREEPPRWPSRGAKYRRQLFVVRHGRRPL